MGGRRSTFAAAASKKAVVEFHFISSIRTITSGRWQTGGQGKAYGKKAVPVDACDSSERTLP